MGYDYYQRDDVTEYLAEQRQRIAELEAENCALRAQLDALCRGEGLAVLINGRQIPLAALAPAAAESPGAPSAHMHVAHGRPRRPSAPRDLYHHPAQRVPMPLPHTPPATPNEAVFPEDAWLTGATPAARPSPAAPTPQRSRSTGAHALRPSERITPEWLRESRHAAASSHQSQPSASYHPHDDAWADSYGQSHFSTLAEITGQLPAARPPRDPSARNPYADSFVLD